MAKQDWEKIWAESKTDIVEDNARLDSELTTLRWREIEAMITSKLGKISGLKTVEVGSGVGDFSILFNRLGATTVLADYSPEALVKAEARFKAHKLEAEYVLADMLSVGENLAGKFDVSFSLGLAEHFSGKDRAEIVAAHAKVLRSGGLTFISIPYKYCPLYQIWMRRLIWTKRWAYGLEIPFSKREIQRLGEAAGLQTVGFIQSSFWGDWNRFFPSRRIGKFLHNRLEKASPLNKLGYALVYVGQKP